MARNSKKSSATSTNPKTGTSAGSGALHPAQSGRRASAGIQSLDQGLDVMRILAHGGSIKLKDVATRAGMSASKAHRYLASLTRAGWAVQSDTAYRLGPEAIAMAAACLAGVSVMKLAMPILEDLCRRSGRSAGLAVWGSHGPTIVALEETADPVSMNIRPGTVAPVLSSASGLVFAAYAPAGLTGDAIATELKERPLRHGFRSHAALTRALADIHAQGFVSIHSGWVAGIDAVAVPVFDHRGRLEAALLTIGRDRRVPGAKTEAAHLKPAIDILRQSGAQLSHKLGYQSATDPALFR